MTSQNIIYEYKTAAKAFSRASTLESIARAGYDNKYLNLTVKIDGKEVNLKDPDFLVKADEEFNKTFGHFREMHNKLVKEEIMTTEEISKMTENLC